MSDKPKRWTSYQEWAKQYRSKENFDSLDGHLGADMLLQSLFMMMNETIEYLEAENKKLKDPCLVAVMAAEPFIEENRKLEARIAELEAERIDSAMWSAFTDKTSRIYQLREQLRQITALRGALEKMDSGELGYDVFKYAELARTALKEAFGEENE